MVAILMALGIAAIPRAAESSSSAPVSRHVYVADPAAGVVFTFPLKNGLVASEPDNYLYPASAPIEIALDPQGDLYVLTAGTSTLSVYAPGVTGFEPAPSRTIALPGDPLHFNTRLGLVVDAQGYVYVGLLEGRAYYVPVYAPGVRAPAVPLRNIRLPARHTPVGLAVDPNQRLYVALDAGTFRFADVIVYANPTTKPAIIAKLCGEVSINAIFAGSGGYLSMVRHRPRRDDTIVAIYRDGNMTCPDPPQNVITPPRLAYLASVTVLGNHVFAVGNDYRGDGAAALYEFNSVTHDLVAQATGQQSLLVEPTAVALGP